MSTDDYSALAARHRNYFRSGITRGVEWRKSQLAALRAMMTERADDFHASGFRAYTNARGVLYHGTVLDLGLRYPPYDGNETLRKVTSHLLA
jgi:hypothetical protein